MNAIRTVEASEHIGEIARFRGWLHNVRRLGGVSFIFLRDGWGIIQAVTEDDADLAPVADLALGSVVALTGLIVANVQAPGGLELQQPKLEVITPVQESAPLPLSKRRLNAALPTLLDHAVVANRNGQPYLHGMRAQFDVAYDDFRVIAWQGGLQYFDVGNAANE